MFSEPDWTGWFDQFDRHQFHFSLRPPSSPAPDLHCPCSLISLFPPVSITSSTANGQHHFLPLSAFQSPSPPTPPALVLTPFQSCSLISSVVRRTVSQGAEAWGGSSMLYSDGISRQPSSSSSSPSLSLVSSFSRANDRSVAPRLASMWFSSSNLANTIVLSFVWDFDSSEVLPRILDYICRFWKCPKLKIAFL
ncbi:hypothetical protein SLEP1_g25627 [Rubroshorea leprosula]|uniref:Uncharacterized protein n=1 Tax=Rubroshorea leprosula TaxID=152421 RepID=A0AAV5JQ13_9ROSI|nr:hypothetical protein SLEP1_g25627 [Rubroshorea leprosula]